MGIIEPLIVRSTGEGTYVLIAGERRLTAAKLVGLAEVPGAGGLVKILIDQTRCWWNRPN